MSRITTLLLTAALGLIMSAFSVQSAPPQLVLARLNHARQLAELEAAVTCLQAQVETLRSQINVLQASPANRLGPYLSVDTDPNPGKHMKGPTITFKGVNINIVNGLNQTRSANGLGNLIIEYNEEPLGPVYLPLEVDGRGGSHCLVVGQGHTFGGSGSFGVTSGCVVFGEYNRVVGNAESVLGGTENSAAYGSANSVAGGFNNQSTGVDCNILGGASNVATGFESTVSGGYWNSSNVDFSSILGGEYNIENSYYSTILGGANNAASWPPRGFQPITILPSLVPAQLTSSVIR
jgi:hypothetical protein